VYATVQKKPKEKPEKEKLSGETDSKRPAGNFYSHFSPSQVLIEMHFSIQCMMLWTVNVKV